MDFRLVGAYSSSWLFWRYVRLMAHAAICVWFMSSQSFLPPRWLSFAVSFFGTNAAAYGYAPSGHNIVVDQSVFTNQGAQSGLLLTS